HGTRNPRALPSFPTRRSSDLGQAMADQLFDAIAKFAEYGFNRSHAAAYAMISYQTAYLKANYPIEYMTSLLIHMQGSADKVAARSEEHTSELQSLRHLVCRLL